MMFTPKVARVAAFVLFGAGAAVLISCQADITSPVTLPTSGPTPTSVGEPVAGGFDAIGVQGTVTDKYTEDPLADVTVNIRCTYPCDFCLVDTSDTDAFGWYECDSGNWGDHDEHTIRVRAAKTGYSQSPPYAWIDPFDASEIPYTVDIEMVAGK
jgi:hypothetical protein